MKRIPKKNLAVVGVLAIAGAIGCFVHGTALNVKPPASMTAGSLDHGAISVPASLASPMLERAKFRTLKAAVTTTGEVLEIANLRAHVTSPVDGRVQEVMVTVGQHVIGGQALLTLRSQTLEQCQAELLQRQAEMKADLKQRLLEIDSDIGAKKAGLELSQSTYKRLMSLVDEKIASTAQLEAAKADYAKDKIALGTLASKRTNTLLMSDERLRLAIDPLKQKLTMLGMRNTAIERVIRTQSTDPVMTIVAPESGLISARGVNSGELIDVNTQLFTIGDYRTISLKGDIYEKDIAHMKKGESIEFETDSYPGEKFCGQLDYIADSVDPDSRTLTVKAKFLNPDFKLKPKMFGKMTIQTKAYGGLYVSSSAIQDNGDGPVVYIGDGCRHFRESPVKTGNKIGDQVEILSGLQPEDKVARSATFELVGQFASRSE